MLTHTYSKLFVEHYIWSYWRKILCNHWNVHDVLIKYTTMLDRIHAT